MLLDLAPGTALSGEQIQAVTSLVSSSVQDMEPDQVTVADSTGQVLSAAGEGMTAAAGDARSQVEQDYENRLSENAQQILDRVVVGPRPVVSVRADVDLERETSRRHLRRGHPADLGETTTEDYTGGGVPVGGVLGPENMPDAAENAGAGDSTYHKESTTANNAVGKTSRSRGRTRRPQAAHRLGRHGRGGRRQPQPAADARPHDHRGRPGRGRGDDIVASLPFDTTAADAAAADMEAAREAEASDQMWSMIRTGGIAAGIALVVLLVWLRSRRTQEVEEEYEPLELSDDMLLELDRLRIQSTREAAEDRHPRWSSRPPSGRRCAGRSPPWSASVPTRSRRCSAAG